MGANPDQAGRQRDVTAALAAAGLDGGDDGPPRDYARADGPLRVVPVGRRIALTGQPGPAELYVLAAAGLPGMLALTVTVYRPAQPADPVPHQRPSAITGQLTVADDRDRSHQVSFSGLAGPGVWHGYLDVDPGPAPDARWVSVGTETGPEFRVDLAATAGATGRATAAPATAGETVVTTIADHLLAAGGQDHPRPGRGVPNLGAVIDALTQAGALPADSPWPGRLATLCERLGRRGHGIGAAARDDLPETWASLLARPGGRAVTRSAAAPAAAVLPAVDEARFALAGLVTGPDGTRLHAVGTGLRTPGWDLPVASGVDHGFSWWLRPGGQAGAQGAQGNQWHVAVVEGYELGTHGEIRLALGVHPALSPDDGDLEVMVTGPASRIRTRLRLRWDPLSR